MPSAPILTITALMAREMGQEAFRALKDQIRETVQRETSEPWEWRPAFHIDAVQLRRSGDA